MPVSVRASIVSGSLYCELRVVVVVARDEDAGARSGEPLARQPGMVERLDRDLEEEPLLRVHALGFARQDAEEGCVEAVDCVEKAARLRGVLLPGAAGSGS